MELTSFAAHAAAFLLSVSLKTVLIFAVAGLVCLGLRRASAASRHLLWAMTLVSLLCLPVFCVLLPPLAAPVLPAPVLPAPQQHRAGLADRAPQVQASITSPSRPANTSATEANFVPAPAASRLPADDKAAVKSISPRVFAQKFNASEGKTAPEVPTQTRLVPSLSGSKPALSATAPKLTGAEWLLAFWLIGMTLVLSRTMLGLLGAVRLVRRSVAVASGPLAEAAEEARRKMGLKTLRSVRDGSLVAVPMTFGIVRPIVLVPEGARDWPAERLQAVMLHEIGHIKRHDWVTAMLAEVVCALYWFHPLVWLAARQLRAESEQACDDLVLTSGVKPAEYAQHLLEVVRGLTARRSSTRAVVTMAYKQDITARLKMILANSKNRSAATGRGLGLAIFVALVIVVPLAAIQPMARSNQANAHTLPTTDSRTVVFSDGTQVRLVEITSVHPENRMNPYGPAWSPDGSPSQFRGVSPSEGFVNSPIERLPGRSRSETYGYARLDLVTTPRRNFDAGHALFVPHGSGHADITVPLATGPYAAVISGPLDRDTLVKLSSGEGVTLSKMVVRPPANNPVGKRLGPAAEVDLTLPDRLLQGGDLIGYRIDALGADKKPIRVLGFSGPTVVYHGHGMTRVAFDTRTAELARLKVSGFRFECRAIHPVIFRNVALQPNIASARSGAGLPPSLMVNMSPATAPKDFDATTWAQTAGDAALRLVAVSDKPSNVHRWWRPDGTPFLYNWHEFGLNFEPSHHLYPEAFLKQWPVLIFRTAHKTDTDLVVIDGWHDPRAFRAKSPGPAEFFSIDKGGYMASSTDLLAKTPQSFSVRLRVSAGPWQVQENDILAGTRSDALASWEVSPLSSSQTGVSLHLTKVSSFQQVRLVAFDAQNHEHYPGTMTTSGNGYYQQFTLAMPLSQIRKLSVETRPYYYRDFYGIARQPVPVTQLASPVPLALVQSREEAQKERVESAANLHLIGQALIQYAGGHEEHLPDAAHWMDQIIPYLVPAQIKGTERQQRIAAVFHDPASPPGQLWSYSFNHALSNVSLSQLDSPAQIVAVFESTRGVRNASDGGQSLPQPGRHSGGSDFLFADGHTKWLRAEDTPLLLAKLNPPVIDSSGNLTHLTQPQDTTGWFSPVNPESRQKIPIQGQAYDRRTMKPLRGTFVIFSQSPNKITVGSVWPSSFTNKAGGFQSILYPGKNYLMVLANNRFRFAGKTLNYEANGNKGSISTQGTKGGPVRSARSDYMVRWTLPQGYSLKASSSPGGPEGANITAFAPIAHSAPR